MTSGASCRALWGVGGDEVLACDARSELDGWCSRDRECVSGQCSSTHCVTPGTAALGDTCTLDADCASGECRATTCWRSAPRGSACTASYECGSASCVEEACE